MRSMTGYGYAEYACDNYLITMELKSYNNRYLEFGYYGPSVLSSYENIANEIIKQHAQRGHVDLSVKLKILKGNLDINIDENAAVSYIKAASRLQDLMSEYSKDYQRLSVGDLLNQEGIITNLNCDGIENYREGLDFCMNKVLQMFDQAKDREGKITRDDLEKKLNSIEESVFVVKKHASELENNIKNQLINKIHEMLGDQNYDENRILTEVAVMLVRYTINEEVVRLSSHIAEFRRLLDSNEAVGKRMDFLSQEMNREINTIGSKSQIVEINFEVVNMKDCLENIREQIRNIE